MVRSTVAFGFLAVASLVLTSPASAAEQEDTGHLPKTAAGELPPAAVPLRPVESADSQVTTCNVCAGPTCTTVQVRGRCTVDKAVDSLRREHVRPGLVPGRLRHRDRAVTGKDYEPLVLDEPPETGRAAAEPEGAPQDETDAGAQLLDVYDHSGRSLSVRESKSPDPETSAFRPLDLSDDSPDDSENADKADKPVK